MITGPWLMCQVEKSKISCEVIDFYGASYLKRKVHRAHEFQTLLVILSKKY